MKKLFSAVLCLVMIVFCCSCTDKLPDKSNSEANEKENVSVMDEIQLGYKEKLPEDWQREVDYINIVKKGKFTFAVQTDTHFEGTNEEVGYNINYLSNTIDLKFYAHLGDIIRGYDDATIDSPENMRNSMDEIVRRYTEDAGCPVIMTPGNHDSNLMWYNAFKDVRGVITEREHYSRIIEPLKEHNGEVMTVSGDDTYYYLDFDEDEIRVIVLNTTDSAFSTGVYSTFNISEEQVMWYNEEALDTDYSVIVMMHTPLIDGFTKNNTVTNGEKILSATESFISRGGDFIAYMCGHIHTQETVTDSNGRIHMSFAMSGSRAEVVMIDKENRVINTVGLGDVKMRSGIEY